MDIQKFLAFSTSRNFQPVFAFSNRRFTEKKKLLAAPDFTSTYNITGEHLQYEIMVMTQVQLIHHLMKTYILTNNIMRQKINRLSFCNYKLHL